MLSTTASDPVPFVGRDAELAQLTTAFATAAAARGGLLLLAGEPGIGKTTLCQRLAAVVAAQGGRALVGRCDDAGPLSVPYLPFIEALRAAFRDQDRAVLVQELGPLAAVLVRLVPELRAELSEPEPSGALSDPVEARYQLLQAVTTCLRSVASAAPVLLVLEDLQDADHGKLDVLAYFGRHLADIPMLVVGTYRDTEVEPRHPLAHTLATIRRSLPIDRVHLEGLPPNAVHALVDRIADRPLPARLARAVYDRAGAQRAAGGHRHPAGPAEPAVSGGPGRGRGDWA